MAEASRENKSSSGIRADRQRKINNPDGASTHATSGQAIAATRANTWLPHAAMPSHFSAGHFLPSQCAAAKDGKKMAGKKIRV
jgi:hypothetical protein